MSFKLCEQPKLASNTAPYTVCKNYVPWPEKLIVGYLCPLHSFNVLHCKMATETSENTGIVHINNHLSAEARICLKLVQERFVVDNVTLGEDFTYPYYSISSPYSIITSPITTAKA